MQAYGFQDELRLKGKGTMFYSFLCLFYSMPLVTIVSFHPAPDSMLGSAVYQRRCPKVFVVHGGIPRLDILAGDVQDLELMANNVLRALNRLQRGREEYEDEVVKQFLWSDPSRTDEAESTQFRGVSFSLEWSRDFCSMLGVDYIIRSHQLVDGHLAHRTHNDRAITIFSCPLQ